MTEQAERPEDTNFAYPPYITTPEQAHRWDVSRGIAIMLCGTGGEPTADVNSSDVWFWTRAIFNLPNPTDELPAFRAQPSPGH